MQILGIDIGGSGIKGAPVDTLTGELTDDRFRIPTPQPAQPQPVADVVAEVARHFAWTGPIGCTFPAVVKDGHTFTAANVAPEWIGYDARTLFQKTTGLPVALLNDADAAGIAEMRFGAGQGHEGVVLMVTLGTGIGTALFYRGLLVPNTELGHIEIRGKDAEERASERVRDEKQLSWKQWAKRIDEYLDRIEALLWPDLIIIGGGVSKEHTRFMPRLTTRARVVPAQLLNEAGIVGAALAACDLATSAQPAATKPRPRRSSPRPTAPAIAPTLANSPMPASPPTPASPPASATAPEPAIASAPAGLPVAELAATPPASATPARARVATPKRPRPVTTAPAMAMARPASRVGTRRRP